jgi:pyruvate,orthophosphate dikinase
MILSETEDSRRRALDKLGPMQRQDFEEIFQIMGDRPVTIRLLDPPLHEFLPRSPEEIGAIAQDMGVSRQTLRQKAESLHEFNPMLGHRGCRLSLSYPEIVEMQVRAVLEAACYVASEGGRVQPEIMVPLVMNSEELKRIRAWIEEIADDVFTRAGRSVAFLIGTMIELPRAALVADEIAEYADFFSYGTNDLTQTTMGLSRDDSGSFLTGYITSGVIPGDPFASIDRHGVGKLVEMGTELGRKARPGLKVGVCGEHGGDPRSIAFFAETGLDYVSCSPYRLPVARLAAAWAALDAESKQ